MKKYPNRRIVIDSRDPMIEGDESVLDIDYTQVFKEMYPDTVEEIDEDVPMHLIGEMKITTFVDSDHARDSNNNTTIIYIKN